MPIMSVRKKAPVSIASKAEECCSDTMCCPCKLCKGHSFGKKLIITLFGLLLVYAIFYIGTLINNNLKESQYIGRADKSERMITVSGSGKVTGQNNIAVTTIGYSNTDKEVAKAQTDNKAVMDQVMVDLKNMGIEDVDLQTNYTIYPDYNYTQERGQELIGYRVSNTVTIKIRDLSKINDVLGLAGKYGATEVSGLNFTIDEPSNLKDEARKKALEDAAKKAQYLAESLGVRLGEVVSYSEYEADAYLPKYYAAEGGGMGGSPETVAGGSKDVVMDVNVTFELIPVSRCK